MTAIALGSASPAMITGSTAPTRVPKTARRISIAIGRLMISAWKRSRSIAWLNSCWTSGMPVTVVSTPAGASTSPARSLGVVDRGLDRLVEANQREGLRAVTAHEGGVADVGVGEDLAHHRIVRERRHGLGDGRLERLGARVAVRVGEDHDHARRLLAEPVGRQRFGLRGLGTLDLPAALAQRPAGRRGPDVEPDDEREARDRQPAPVPVGEASERGEDAVVGGAVIGRRRGRGLGRGRGSAGSGRPGGGSSGARPPRMTRRRAAKPATRAPRIRGRRIGLVNARSDCEDEPTPCAARPSSAK